MEKRIRSAPRRKPPAGYNGNSRVGSLASTTTLTSIESTGTIGTNGTTHTYPSQTTTSTPNTPSTRQLEHSFNATKSLDPSRTVSSKVSNDPQHNDPQHNEPNKLITKSPLFTNVPDSNDIYDAILKVILLDYINEPRFKQHLVQIPKITRSPSPPTRQPDSKVSRAENFLKRRSWMPNEREFGSIPKDAIPKLEDRLKQAVDKTKFKQSELTRRCSLSLYTELLKPNLSLINIEEVLMLFIKCANKECQTYSLAHNIQPNPSMEINALITIFIDVLKTCKKSETSIAKLEASRPESLAKSQSEQVTYSLTTDSKETLIKPSFQLSDISFAKLLIEIFHLDSVKVQNDVKRLSASINNTGFILEIQVLKNKLKKNESSPNPDDFEHTDDYFTWKKKELTELDKLINKFSIKTSEQKTSKQLNIIPADPRSIASEFLIIIFRKAKSIGDVSNEVKSLFTKCCEYWRINKTTQSTLLYYAAHQSVLNNDTNQLNVEQTDILIGAITKLLSQEDVVMSKSDTEVWNWGLSATFNQVLFSINKSIEDMYKIHKVEIEPFLILLHQFLEPDPFYKVILKAKSAFWIKKLRETIRSTTVKRYIQLLSYVPKDDTLGFNNVDEISQEIYDEIKKLNKCSNQELILGEINIEVEASIIYIGLFTQDAKNMISHIEYYARSRSIYFDFTIPLESYHKLRVLRNYYEKMKKPDDQLFSFNLEDAFFKYFKEFCEESCQKVLPLIKESFSKDSLEPIDESHSYSVLVIDVFKLFNETIDVFKNYGWENEKQLSIVYAIVMKFVSEIIVNYSLVIKEMFIEELKEEINQSFSDHRQSGIWSFDELKSNVYGEKEKESVISTYEFSPRVCVALNNLSEIKKQLDNIESRFSPGEISSSSTYKVKGRPPRNDLTLLVKHIENLVPSNGNNSRNPYVVITDMEKAKDIGKTKSIPKTLNPFYDEEFEFELSNENSLSLSFKIWDLHTRTRTSEFLCNIPYQIDLRKFTRDGIPQEFVIDLRPQGTFIFSISLESEKDDITYSIGRAHRKIDRTMEKCYTLIVEKFLVFISDSFSRQTLKTICGGSGTRSPTSQEIYDSLDHLFDYFNVNFKVLNQTLDDDIFNEIMLQVWKAILNSADSLLLPAVSSVKIINFDLLSSESNLKNSFNAAFKNMKSSMGLPGSRPLTLIEMDSVFVYLKTLYSFFHNDGAGPSAEELNNDQFQKLLLIQNLYNESTETLKVEIGNKSMSVFKAIEAKHFLLRNADNTTKEKFNTLERRNTNSYYGSFGRRASIRKLVEESDKLTMRFAIHREDIILRILLVKGEQKFVYNRLKEREKFENSVINEKRARIAVLGR